MRATAIGDFPGRAELSRYWAKAGPTDGASVGYHPFLWHTLDVAACAQASLRAHPVLRGRFVALLGQDADPLALIGALAAIHDLGKLSLFQHAAPDIHRLLDPEGAVDNACSGSNTHRVPHVDVGFALWADQDEGVSASLPLSYRQCEVLTRLAVASFGHHGVPPDQTDNLMGLFGRRARRIAVQQRCSRILCSTDLCSNP